MELDQEHLYEMVRIISSYEASFTGLDIIPYIIKSGGNIDPQPLDMERE